MQFWSPTLGDLEEEQLVKDLLAYVSSSPDSVYRFIIGSDSQTFGSRSTHFVTVIIVHRLGKGARTYLTGSIKTGHLSLRQKIYTEAAMSLEVCGWLKEQFQVFNHQANLEVHLDVGHKGATKALVKEIVGWVTHSGFRAVIKPDSFGASKVADRYARDQQLFAR